MWCLKEQLCWKVGDAIVLCGDSHLFQAQPNYKYTIRVWYVGICNLHCRGFVWVGGIEPPVFKCACEKGSLFLSLQQDYRDQWTKRIGTSWPHLNHSGHAGFIKHSGAPATHTHKHPPPTHTHTKQLSLFLSPTHSLWNTNTFHPLFCPDICLLSNIARGCL